MRARLTIDDALLRAAQESAGIENKSELVRHALRALIEREAAKRLAALGGTEPDLKAPPRRRFS